MNRLLLRGLFFERLAAWLPGSEGEDLAEGYGG